MQGDEDIGIRITSKRIVMQERRAFVLGVEWATPLGDPSRRIAANAARQLFMLPTRQRVVVDPHDKELRWTVRCGEIALYDRDRIPCCPPTTLRVALWADLLAHPTEEMEDDS